MPRFYTLPRIVGILSPAARPDVRLGTGDRARALSSHRPNRLRGVGCTVSYDGNGIPIDWDHDPDAELIEAIYP